MSPAPFEPDDPRLLSLANAFEGLLLTVQQLSCSEKNLQLRLKYAHDEYAKLADRLGPDAYTQDVSGEIVSPLPDVPKSLKPADAVRTLADSGHLDDQTLVAISDGLECYRSVTRPDEKLGACPVKHGASGLEEDFTTNGTHGSLRCPFARNKSENWDGVEDAFKLNGDTCGHEDLDPIKAELNDKNSTVPSTRSSARCPVSRCPIRFLNQHSPQEVADYVERHKHEIPRSHAVCVQRYQRNSNTMRRLDAKYGGLINMIQGLGEKHQTFLPNQRNSMSSASGVEKWAADVDSKSQMNAIKEDEGEERQGHFDRPLREIRVGESPSRPWGISVPVAEPPLSPAAPAPAPAPSSGLKVPDEANVEASSAEPFQNSPRGCPFGHDADQADNVHETETVREEQKGEREESKPANVVFNGPVFFGYTAEQTAGLMQQLGR